MSRDNSAYRLVVSCKLDNEMRYFEFDKCDERTITASSEMTIHPMVDGDMVADHIIKQPTVVNFSGAFSVNGNQAAAFNRQSNSPNDLYNAGQDRLTQIETVFERIKDEGILCKLITMTNKNNTSHRFKTRDNMVLTAITWIEKENTMDFSFSFTEALLADVAEYDVDTTDDTLPICTEPATMSLSETLLNWDEVDKCVMEVLQDCNLISQEFINDIAQDVTVIATCVAAGVVITGLTSLAVALVSNPVGWVVGAVVGVAVCIGVGIWKLCSLFKKQKKLYKIEEFKHYKKEKKRNKELKRFYEYFSHIHNSLKQLDQMAILYSITDNCQQEVCVNLDSDYYTFLFLKDNTSGKWRIEIKNGYNESVCTSQVIEPVSNLFECSTCNALYTTPKSHYKIYMANPEITKIENSTSYSQYQRNNAIDDAKKDLTNYVIFIAKMDMDNFREMIKEIIFNDLKI